MKKHFLLPLLLLAFNMLSAQQVMFHYLNGDSLFGEVTSFKPKNPCGNSDLGSLIGSTCSLNMVSLVVKAEDNTEKTVAFKDLKDFWIAGTKFAVVNGSKAYEVLVDGKFPLYRWYINLTIHHKKYDGTASKNAGRDIYVKSENTMSGMSSDIFFVPKYKVPCNEGYFKKQYADIMKDCPEVVEKIKKGEIDKTDLIKAFKAYNELCNK